MIAIKWAYLQNRNRLTENELKAALKKYGEKG